MNFTHSSGFYVAIYPDNSPKDSERVLDFSTVKQTKGSGNKASYPDLCLRSLPEVYPTAIKRARSGGGGKQLGRVPLLKSAVHMSSC